LRRPLAGEDVSAADDQIEVHAQREFYQRCEEQGISASVDDEIAGDYRELVGETCATPVRENPRPARRPRIALVSKSLARNSTQAAVFAALVQQLSDRIDFVVVSDSLPTALRTAVQWRRVPAPSQLHLGWAVFFLLGSLRLLRARVDLVHGSAGKPLVLNRLDLLWLHFCHAEYDRLRLASDRSALRRLVRLTVRSLERWSCRSRVRMLAAVSSDPAADFARHFPGVAVSVVPLPLDTDRFRPDPEARVRVRDQAGVEPQELVAIFVGRNWKLKGLDIAVEGVARASEAGLPVRLWVFGGEAQGSRASELRSRAERLGVGGRVELFGSRNDIECFYQAADVLVLPTLYENQSRAMLEAAACELPLIVPAVNGITEIVGDGEAGMVVPRAPAAIADALLQLGSDPALRARMGSAGRARVVPYTMERTVDSTIALYRRLLPPELATCLAPGPGKLTGMVPSLTWSASVAD
jgi:glycosyltransferase involved in cell wall biosynthesis